MLPRFALQVSVTETDHGLGTFVVGKLTGGRSINYGVSFGGSGSSRNGD